MSTVMHHTSALRSAAPQGGARVAAVIAPLAG